jgi:Na+/H+ antiporter NhaD/arsenite permease-like protein
LTPPWAVVPFLLDLLLIAALPLFWARFWDSNWNKLTVGLIAAAPVVGYLLGGPPEGARLLLDSGREYAAFMTLLGALFVISGGIHLRGALAGTPAVNTAFLAAGALLASVIGTTGASALLIRPLLRANHQRQHRRHLVIFFIFIVSNAGGLLTPLGDPPLFLGFLRGVPFSWTLRLAAPWAMVNGALLAIFALFDRFVARAEIAPPHGSAHRAQPTRRAAEPRQPLRVDGKLNLVWLLGVVATVFALGAHGRRWLPDQAARSCAQITAMVAFAALSLATTDRRIHELNRFTWAPLHEVAVVFAGIFVTMVPAMSFLHERGASLGIALPWQFFWAAGALSSVLDNAPTYLTFASLATGVADAGAGQLSAHDLGALAAHPVGQHLLAAVSCGSVFMGAITYIGNGPNFMIKAIAEQHHVRMPSFFGYTSWSVVILLPLFAVVALVFFS